MVQISISIGGSSFVVGCEDGDEEHVKNLAKDVEERYRSVRQHLAPSGEAHALFLSALFLADELNDLRNSQASDEERKIIEKADEIIRERREEEERILQAAELAEGLAKQFSAPSLLQEQK